VLPSYASLLTTGDFYREEGIFGGNIKRSSLEGSKDSIQEFYGV